MKLTEEQLVVLKDTLKDWVAYRETYEEVYDHLLTALEYSDNSLPLAQTLNNIMLNDFGGYKGLKLIERKRKWRVVRQMLTKLGSTLLTFLKLPLLPVTCFIYLLVYYCVSELKFNIYVVLIFCAAVMFGMVFKSFRYLKRRFILKDTKKSIKDLPFFIITYYPFYILFSIKIIELKFYKDEPFSNWFALHPLVQSFIYTVYLIYIISFSKLYLQDFKRLDTKFI